MDIYYIAQMLTNAVVAGVIYALIALGFTLIFGIARVVNFAHGEIYMLGAFLTFYIVAILKLPYVIGVIIAAVILSIIGIILERILFRRIRPSEVGTTEEFPTVALTLALALILPSLATVTFGASEKGVSSNIVGVLRIGGVSLPYERIIIVIIGLLMFLGLLLFILRHKEGQALNAVAQNPEAALMQGISLNRAASLSFAIGLGLAGASGGLLAPLYYVEPSIGPPALLKTFIVVILGGIGSVTGTLIGGLLLGFIEVTVRVFIGGSFPMLISFVILMIVLIIKPKGILGHD
jgi:branched-chain amino acid transport system permease protein